MKILLTGGSGMVGQNILKHPKSKHYNIISPTREQLNLLNFDQVVSFLRDQKPTFIVHAAGIVGGIQANIKNPIDFLVKNSDIGRNILLAAKENNIKHVLNLGSSCMYPKNAENPLKENQILSGSLEPTNEGYAIAKIYTLKLCEYISRQSKLFLYKTAIPCNLYGKYDSFSAENSHMIPAVIKKIISAKKNNQNVVEIWGDGTARREFMYAEDLADFIFYAIDHFSLMPVTINVGLGHDFSIKQYYQSIAKQLNFKGKFKYNLTKPTGMKQKLVDVSKLIEFGWKHSTTLEMGIKKTINFYKKNYIQ